MRGILWLSLVDQVAPVSPVHPDPPNHFHVTLAFRVTLEETGLAHRIGERFQVQCHTNNFNDRIQALAVTLPAELSAACRNRNPHITISMADGVRPVESNAMLEDYNRIVDGAYFTVETVLEFQPFN